MTAAECAVFVMVCRLMWCSVCRWLWYVHHERCGQVRWTSLWSRLLHQGKLSLHQWVLVHRAVHFIIISLAER